MVGKNITPFFLYLTEATVLHKQALQWFYHPVPRNEEELRAWHLRNLASAAAYTVLIFVEHPAHRRSAINYAVEALRGTTRPWRVPTAKPRRQVVSAYECY